MQKLEQRLYSLQSANAMDCNMCRPLVLRVKHLEKNLKKFANARREQLQELCKMK